VEEEQPKTAAPTSVARRLRDPRVAAGLSIIPGVGQLYNGQPRKAAYFLLTTFFAVGPAVALIMTGERLGSALLDRRAFTAFLLLAFGSIIIFLALFCLGLAFWASAVVDARRSAIELNEGRPPTERWRFLRL
jgi:arabinogalactan oligomer/maltooligosaccharide transport system permease protein